jgi:hypothetical protein
VTTEVLHQLIELTTSPPETTDVDELLRAFATMFDARQRLLDQPGLAFEDSPEARALARELAARDAEWERALAVARDAIGAVRQNTSRLRAYR